MSDVRTERLRALNSLYRLYPGSGDSCVYCGVPADTYDHVPALAIVQASSDKDSFSCYLVPACRECNSLLGTQGLTVTDRRVIVKKKLKARYRTFLKCAKGTPNELDDLGTNLREIVESGADIGEWMRRRLSW